MYNILFSLNFENMKKMFFIFFFTLFVQVLLFSQGETDEQKKIFYRNESTFGVLLNSNGYGINYRYGIWRNAFNKRIYEIDLLYTKHPKEIRNPNSPPTTNQNYVYGKLNNFMNLRGGIGNKTEMFRKIDKGGVSIKYFYTFGPTLGFLKPIYYIYKVDSNQYVSKKMDPDTQDPSKPEARDSFFKGMSEIKFNPGAFAKFGINFEYSTVDELIHAIEIGVGLDGYLLGVPLMAHQKKKHLFFQMFISYRFGKIVDAQKIKRKRKKNEEFTFE
jgi:hypothetical protein